MIIFYNRITYTQKATYLQTDMKQNRHMSPDESDTGDYL